MVWPRLGRLATLTVGLSAGLAASVALAADYRLEPVTEAAPGEELAEAISEVMAPAGVRVKRGNRTVCEFWPCETWNIEADFQASAEVLYPFRPGQLIGALRFRRRGSDFRDQRIDRGVYTLRYGQQPVDGNHEGTSPTRDFLMMVPAAEDDSIEDMAPKRLEELSAEAAGSEHPALMALQRPQTAADAALPALRHDEDRDWWILQISAPVKGDASRAQLPIEVVVVGVAEE